MLPVVTNVVQKLQLNRNTTNGFQTNLFDFSSYPIMELLELGVLCHRAIENFFVLLYLRRE